jgi:hypothetical protein
MRAFLLWAGLLGLAGPAAAADTPALHYYRPVPAGPARTVEADLVVYGGTPGGVTAAIQATRMGKTAVLATFNKHVGGLTSGGLTATDLGNARAIGGLSREFFDRVGKDRDYLPSKAEATFRAMLADAMVPLYEDQHLTGVTKDGNRITAATMEGGITFKGKVFVDATYEGDLLAAAGVKFHVGREANGVYGETINGIQMKDKHQFNFSVDPYKVEGDPKSGLLWGISPEPLGKPGDGDRKVQAYNFRVNLTKANGRLPYPKPAGYDASKYELLLRYLLTAPDSWKFDQNGPFQLREGDCNNAGAFSTDYIGANYAWPEADYATRERIFQDHVEYQQGLYWFLANDPRLPESVREKANEYGLNPGEFKATGGWPHQLYIREGRRMLSDYVMTEHDCLGHRKASDPVGLASYTMDSHNCQRVVIVRNGKAIVKNEGDVQARVPQPYGVSYRAIVPKEAECANLFVPVCLSSSHISYGSIRMEPVFMILGQSAGTAAVLAIDAGVPVQKVEYPALRKRLVADRQILEWVPPPAVKAKPAKKGA